MVYCTETGNYFAGEPLANCTFGDGTPGGCYSARTGGDLTVPGRSERPKLPECWQV
jgi:hypothetical protein